MGSVRKVAAAVFGGQKAKGKAKASADSEGKTKVREKKAAAMAANARVRVEKASAAVVKLRAKLSLAESRLAELGQAADAAEQVIARSSGQKRSADSQSDLTSAAKKSRYSEDPFSVEKSKYNQRLFTVNNPFVELKVFDKLEYMRHDKVSDGKRMREDTLTEAQRILLRPVSLLRKQYKSARTELGGRILHAGLLMNMKLLTRPQRHPLTEWESESESEDGDDTTDVDPEDIVLQAGGEYVPKLLDPPSDDSNEFAHEGNDVFDPLELLRSSKFDLAGSVYDRRVGKVDNLVTVLLVECEWESLSINKSFQGGAYCMKKAVKNMQKGRYEPIYVQSWGSQVWRHGVFFPEAIVDVRDGHVVGASNGHDVKLLDDKLQRWTKVVAADYPVTQFPDGQYAKGKYKICKQKLQIPLQWTTNAGRLPDVRLFFQSLLRIFVGDKVLDWTPADLRSVVEGREREISDDVSSYL